MFQPANDLDCALIIHRLMSACEIINSLIQLIFLTWTQMDSKQRKDTPLREHYRKTGQTQRIRARNNMQRTGEK